MRFIVKMFSEITTFDTLSVAVGVRGEDVLPRRELIGFDLFCLTYGQFCQCAKFKFKKIRKNSNKQRQNTKKN